MHAHIHREIRRLTFDLCGSVLEEKSKVWLCVYMKCECLFLCVGFDEIEVLVCWGVGVGELCKCRMRGDTGLSVELCCFWRPCE